MCNISVHSVYNSCSCRVNADPRRPPRPPTRGQSGLYNLMTHSMPWCYCCSVPWCDECIWPGPARAPRLAARAAAGRRLSGGPRGSKGRDIVYFEQFSVPTSQNNLHPMLHLCSCPLESLGPPEPARAPAATRAARLGALRGRGTGPGRVDLYCVSPR